jgi:hypothetical protein
MKSKRSPYVVKHICGHTTKYYRDDPAFIEWAKSAARKTCGSVACAKKHSKS